MSGFEMGGMRFDGNSPIETHAPVFRFDSFAYPTERHYAQAQAAPRDDFDPYSHHNEQTPDSFIENMFDLALNEPLPEKIPDLTTSEGKFAMTATELLTQFSQTFPKPPSAEALTELTKMFRENRVSPDLVDAINMMLDKADLKFPLRLGLSEVTGLICLGTGDADGHFTKRFFISDNRGVKR